MPTTFASSRILQPVSPWFIALSLIVALLANFLPTAAWPWLPDWVALVLVFWYVREPRHVGMGSGFVLGLAMDVADSSVLGQHALAYVLAAYAGAWLSRRILWFPVAKVVHIERDTSYSFARIYCVPLAGVENYGDVMILDPREPMALPAPLKHDASASAAGKPPAKPMLKKPRVKKE